MPAPVPLVKLLLRQARAAEDGDAYFLGLQTTCAEIAASGGTQLTSASAAGKAYTYAVGYSIAALTEALDEAQGIWAEYSEAQIARMLDTRPRRTTYGTFC